MSYEEIIHLPHYTSEKRLRMPALSRAAQFAPFSALTGHEDALAETARLTADLTEWDDDIKAEINRRLVQVAQQKSAATFIYFVPDEKKDGGAYQCTTGVIKRIDEINRLIHLTNGAVLPLDLLCGLE